MLSSAGGLTTLAASGLSAANLLGAENIEPTTSELRAQGTLHDGSNTPSVKWTLYTDGTLIVEPINGVSGTFQGYGTGTGSTIVAAMEAWPWYPYHDEIINVRFVGSIKVTGEAPAMFRENYSKLKYVDFSGLDTSALTRVRSFMYNNKAIEIVNFSNFSVAGIKASSLSEKFSWFFNGNNNLSMIIIGPEFEFVTTDNVSGSGSWYRLDNPEPGQSSPISWSSLIRRKGSNLAGTWVRAGYNPSFTIAFNGNGATGSMDSMTVNITEHPQLPHCTFESDLNFAGWSTDPDAIVPEYSDGAVFNGIGVSNQTVTLYAIWMGEDDFQLHYDANGGYVHPQWRRVHGADDTVTTPVPVHPDNTFKFLYWTTNADGTGERFAGTVSGAAFGAEAGDTVTLYAQYYDPSKGSSVRIEHYQQNAGLDGYTLSNTDFLGVVELNASVKPEKKDYKGFILPTEFQVWAGAATECTTQDDGTEVTVVAGGLTIRYYYDRTRYTLAFNGNGEGVEGTMSDMDMIGGVPAKLPVNRFTKANAVFVGWNTAADGSGTNYGDGQSVNSIAGNDETLTLYAQWFNLDDAQSAEATNGEYTVKCKANETIVFPQLPAGTHYTITEVDLPDGWTLDGIENSTGIVLSAERVNVTATNRYSATGYADLSAHKSLPGESITTGQFTFELADESGTVLQTVSNSPVDEAEYVVDDSAEGSGVSTKPNPYYGMAPVRFDTISYDKQGVYHYTIREVKGSDTSISYDEHVENVTVVVTDRGDGRLITQVLYDQSGVDFRNDMSPGDLTVSKTLRNATPAAEDQEFFFTVYLFDSAGNAITEEYPVTISNGTKTTVRSGGGVRIRGGESFTVTGLPHKSRYIVAESPVDGFELSAKSGDEGRIQAGETAEASFTNAYFSTTQKGTGAVIEASKILEGGEIQEEQFSFRLLDSSGEEIETVYASPDGKVEFSALHYTLDDNGARYTYYVEEVPGDDPDIIYDTHREKVAVQISDNGDGSMTAEVFYDEDNAEFKNTIGHGALKISKRLVNVTEQSKDTEFSFIVNLKDAEGNSRDGSFDVAYSNGTFGKLETGGTIVLKNGESAVIERLPYQAEYEVIEQVKENFELTGKNGDTGVIGANETAEASFENTDVKPSGLALQARKELKNGTLEAGMFSFELVDMTEGSALYKKVIETAKVSADGNVTFKSMEFTKADVGKTFTYIIREIAGTDELMQYDTHEETVQVIVELDSEGLISARAVYDADGAVFVNEKLDQLPDPPLEPDDPPSRPRNRSERTTTYTTGFPPGQGPQDALSAAGGDVESEGAGDSSGVLGALRDPIGAIQEVLGASRLPQTGMLWWPVPVMMISGAGLIIFGRKKRKEEEEE
jgi:pilin isopeptide linkage protein